MPVPGILKADVTTECEGEDQLLGASVVGIVTARADRVVSCHTLFVGCCLAGVDKSFSSLTVCTVGDMKGGNMSRQRRRAIMRRLEKIKARDLTSRTIDLLVSDLIVLDALRDEMRSITMQTLERRPFLSSAEARLYRHYKGMRG